MDWSELFHMQKKLDEYIAENNDLSTTNLFKKKLLALWVELGELANETRCFKFWSTQNRSPKETVLEEYVDGLHFILSLGLEEGFTFSELKVGPTSLQETDQFMEVFAKGMAFQKARDEQSYENLFMSFLQLGEILGFSEQEIQAAYHDKNQVNYQRQDDGY